MWLSHSTAWAGGPAPRALHADDAGSRTETPDALWAQDGRPVQLPSWLHRAGRGTPSEQLWSSAPQTHQPHPEGQGLGAPHAVSPEALGIPGPCSCPPSTCLPAGEGKAHEAAQLSAGPPGQRVEISAGGSRPVLPRVHGAPTALPARARPPAGAESMPKGEPDLRNPTRLDPAQGQLRAGNAASGPLPASPPGLSGLVACSPGQNCSSGGTIRRDHWVSHGHLPPGTASDPTFQLLCRAGGCQQLWNHPGTAASLPREATFLAEQPPVAPENRPRRSVTPVPATSPGPGRIHLCPGVRRTRWGLSAEPRGQPWPRCPVLPRAQPRTTGPGQGAGPGPRVDEDRPAPGGAPVHAGQHPRWGCPRAFTLALDTR